MRHLFLLLFCLLSTSSVFCIEIQYTYDALGRLTFAKDKINGNRDYAYDAAGNRCRVSVGVADNDDQACTDPIPKPKPTPVPSGASCTWSTRHSFSSGNQSGSYYEYPPVGACVHSLKMVTTINGRTTVTYR